MNYRFEIKTARIAKSGIYRYTKGEMEGMTGESFDSDYVNVYRPAIVLANAVDKFKSVPLTLEHPSGFVTPENYQRLAVGAVMDTPCVSMVGDEVAIDNKIMLGSLQAYNALSRGIKELSPGYVAKFKKAHGEYKGQSYDAVMTDIEEVNHFAITKRARGGHQTRILDSGLLRGDTGLKTGLFHRIFKSMVKDSDRGFNEIVDSIAEGKETADSLQGYIDTLPESEDKEKLSRYIEDLSAGTGVFDSDMLKKGAEEIKALYAELDKRLTGDSNETDTSEKGTSEEDLAKDTKEEAVKEEKEEVKEVKEENKEETEGETADGCGSKDSQANVGDSMEDKEEDKAAEVRFAFDSLEETEKSKLKDFVVSLVADSLKDKDSEIHKAIFGVRKREYKRYATAMDSVKDSQQGGAISEYERLKAK